MRQFAVDSGIVLVATCTLMIVLISFGKSVWAQEDGGSMTVANTATLLHQENIPGFEIECSETTRDSGNKTSEYLVSERWVRRLSDNHHHVFVRITVNSWQNQRDAMAAASGIYHATTEDEQPKSVGKPTPGSCTGELIGDYCWTYTVSMSGRNSNTGGTIVVVWRNFLVKVQVTSAQTTVDKTLCEELAKVVIGNLATWTPPQ